MSLRALGRQFLDFVNPPAYKPMGQGQLLDPGRIPKFTVDTDVKEAGRRRMAGENNPSAPWAPKMLQHHFLPTHNKYGKKMPPEPVQGNLDL